MKNLDSSPTIFMGNQYKALCQKIYDTTQSASDALEVSKTKNHIFVLDGVRGVACLAVLWFHMNFLARVYGIWLPLHGLNNILGTLAYFGDSGVILFFLLSGFLLFLPYAKALVFDGNWPGWRRFYLRRIFRIIPGYYVALFLIILFFHPEFLHSDHRHQLWQFLTFRMDGWLSGTLNGPFWTLAIEFQFYMLLPIIAWVFSLIIRRGGLHSRMIKLSVCLCAMFTWGLLTRFWGLSIADTPTLDFLLPHTIWTSLKPYIYGDGGKFFEVFAVGMLICVLYVYTQNAAQSVHWQIRLRRWSPAMFFVGLMILAILSLWHFYLLNLDVYKNINLYHVFTFLDPYMISLRRIWPMWQASGYALCYGLCIMALLFGSAKLKKPFEWPLLRWVGLISFSLYMWHLPFIFLYVNVIQYQFQGWNNNHSIAYAALYCWVLFLIIPVSLTLYRWIEMPGMRIGEMLIRNIGKLQQKPQPPTTPCETKEQERDQQSWIIGPVSGKIPEATEPIPSV